MINDISSVPRLVAAESCAGRGTADQTKLKEKTTNHSNEYTQERN